MTDDDKSQSKIDTRQPDDEPRMWFRLELFVPANRFDLVQSIAEAARVREFISGPYERVWHDGRDEFRPSYERLRVEPISVVEKKKTEAVPSGRDQ